MKRFIDPDIVIYLFLLLLGVGGFMFSLMWPGTLGFQAFTICAALAGLGVTFYIYYSKHFKDHLACPTGSDCNAVVNSKYSTFLGIPLEYLGMLYYATIFLSYIGFIFSFKLYTGIWLPIVLILTAAAFVFSIYLIIIQAFVLRKWCIWCLLSAALSIGIFIISLSATPFARDFLIGIQDVLSMFSSLGFVLGMGGATSALFVFFKFLKDYKIDDNEAAAFKGLSELIWLGLGLVFISKYALYVSSPETFSNSNVFLVQIIALSIAFLTTAFLNVLCAPLISVLPFHQEKAEGDSPSALSRFRGTLFVVGGISLVSWYFAFILGHIPDQSITLLLYTYGLSLTVGLILSLIVNKELS